MPLIGTQAELEAQLAADADLADLVASIAEIQDAVDDIWGQNYQPWFTDHGPSHSKRVAECALRLTLLPNLNPALVLTALEAFVLFAAAWLHDIGMQYMLAAGSLGTITEEGYLLVRHEHPHRSSQNILEGWQNLGLPKDDWPLAEAIAGVAKAHGTKYYRDTVNNILGEVMTVRNRPVRARLLAAILLFADELDLHYQRTRTPPGWAKLNAISEAHSFKHRIVQSVKPVCKADGQISIELELAFPSQLHDANRDAIRRWIEVKLLKQMGMVEPELERGFQNQARFDRMIKTSVRPMHASIALPSKEALAIIRAETLRDDLINHQSAFKRIKTDISANQIIVVLPRQPERADQPEDGQSDLIEAITAEMTVEGRKVAVSKRGSYNLTATSGEVLTEWAQCLASPADPTAAERSRDEGRRLDELADIVAAAPDTEYLFAIIGGEHLEQPTLAWLVTIAIPRIRGIAPACAVLLTAGSASQLTLPSDLQITVQSMSDLAVSDATAYLQRFVPAVTAAAEANACQDYESVKRLAQQHQLARLEQEG